MCILNLDTGDTQIWLTPRGFYFFGVKGQDPGATGLFQGACFEVTAPEEEMVEAEAEEEAEAPAPTSALEKFENTARKGQAETGGVTAGVVLGGGRMQTSVEGRTETKRTQTKRTETKRLGGAEPLTREPTEARQELQHWVLKGAVAFEGDALNVPPKGALPARPRTHTQATAFRGLRGGNSREGGRDPWREAGRREAERKCDYVSLCGGDVVREERAMGSKEPFGTRTIMATLTEMAETMKEMPVMPTGPPSVERDLQRDLLPGWTFELHKRLQHTGYAQALRGSVPLGEAQRRKDTHAHAHNTHNSFGAAAHMRGEDGGEEMAGVLRMRGGDGVGQGGTELNARDTHAMVNAALQVLRQAQAQHPCTQARTGTLA